MRKWSTQKFGVGYLGFQGAEAQEEGGTAFPVEDDHPMWWKMPLLQAAAAEGGT